MGEWKKDTTLHVCVISRYISVTVWPYCCNKYQTLNRDWRQSFGKNIRTKTSTRRIQKIT